MAKRAKAKKLPKSIAGVKIPKTLRKGSGNLAALIESPTARAIAADALIAIAGVLAGNDRSRRAVAGAGVDAAEAGANAAGRTGDAVRGAAEIATGLVAEAARQVLPSSLGGKDEDDVVQRVDKKGKDRDFRRH
jgi:2-keto-4-pentenoate hydratase/2-oxohepta-3-ene-1,7-dioic acid hydratase in catechol pathway